MSEVPAQPDMHGSLPSTPDAARFVGPASRPSQGRLLRVNLHLADRPLVTRGQRIEAGQPIAEHFRELESVEIPSTVAVMAYPPGAILDQVPVPRPGRRAPKDVPETYRARVLEHGLDGVTRLVAGSAAVPVQAPAGGLVEAVTPGHIDIRADGLAVDARVGWGRPAFGRLLVAVDRPDAEMQTSRIDVAAAGAVLVVGVRADVEALSRARAIGAAAIIAGSAASRDLRQLTSSDARQQAALHAGAPFGLLALAGYGRAPIPGYLWDLLVAADGRPVGVLPEARTLIIEGDAAPLLDAATRPPGTVRATSGEQDLGEGRIVGLAGPRRWPGGTYAPGGFVETPDGQGGSRRHCLPLTVLERLG
jgi:hypothetical protein